MNDYWEKVLFFLTYKKTFRESCENYRQCFEEAMT